MAHAFAKIAFTPAVRARQDRMGSGRYDTLLDDDHQGGDRLGASERAFIEARDGFYQATVSETGWPYVQFRGGAPGFLRVVNDRMIAYADLRGNRQYISLGNLDTDNRIALILMDYPGARRLKIWGRAIPHEVAPAPGTEAPAERVVQIRVEAFDWNCPNHIPRRYTVTEAHDEVTALRAENAHLRAEARALRHAFVAHRNDGSGPS
ncbi:MAG: pyridoxamine 5'-phosphate oxidase family protein [Silicimonas sp.]|nr:pyridoxamine 5'-phosphate oxidase family protein [Silicimonas sp.]